MIVDSPKVLASAVDRDALSIRAKLDEGAQGTVYSVNGRIDDIPRVVYKEYWPAERKKLRAGVLREMVDYYEGMPATDQSELLCSVAWPIRLVKRNLRIVGFLMPEIPPRFRVNYTKPSGASELMPSRAELFLEPDAWLAKRGLALSLKARYMALYSVWEKLSWLHARGIVVGDFSMRNLLLAFSGTPMCYLLDADSMAVGNRSPMPKIETPEWDVRAISREPLGTFASDCYKLGLLALRLFAGKQATRNVDEVRSKIHPEFASLIEATLVPNAETRPPLEQWADVLLDGALVHSTCKVTNGGLNVRLDIDGLPGAFKYRWGDGTSSSFALHTYAAAGRYNIFISRQNSRGSSGKPVAVDVVEPPPPPVVDFSVNATNLTAQVDALGTTPVGRCNFLYDWGDGSKHRTTSVREKHDYARPGRYKVTVTAENSSGASTDSKTVKVGGAVLRINPDTGTKSGSANSGIAELVDTGSGITGGGVLKRVGALLGLAAISGLWILFLTFIPYYNHHSQSLGVAFLGLLIPVIGVACLLSIPFAFFLLFVLFTGGD